MERPRIRNWQPWLPFTYAHLKRDGQLIFLEKNSSTMSRVTLTTRIGTDLSGQLEWWPVLDKFRAEAQPGEWLLCELFAPGYPQSEVKHFLATHELDELYLEAFAVGHMVNYCTLEDCQAFCESVGMPFTPFLNVKTTRLTDEKLEEWWRSALPDAEGLVCKDGNLLNWMKRKEKRTADLIVTGYTEGEGKYTGLLGALECSLYQGPTTCSCSGMTDEVRRQISADFPAYLGRVVEVSYQYIGAGGGLRHPQFVRFRDDKRPEDCTEL